MKGDDIIIWRRIDLPGHEIGILTGHNNGWRLAGTAVFVHDHVPCKIEYAVVCDAAWRTRLAEVTGTIGRRNVDLSITVDASQTWRLNGEECPSVAGCYDIDLGFSPSTNLLPIRRLLLDVGQSAEVRAAWLPFPGLEFEPLAQSYRREGEHTYRYASRDGAFVRTLEVNRNGMVTDYPGIWQAEAAAG